MNYEKLLLWKAGTRTEQIAAELAYRIEGGKFTKWDELPLNRTLAGEFDVHPRLISSVKSLLAQEGLLKLEGRRYYVA